MMPAMSSADPELLLVAEHKPPIGRKIYMVSRYGSGFLGDWYKGCGAVSWMPLPRHTPEQKRKLLAMEAAGLDPTKPGGGI